MYVLKNNRLDSVNLGPKKKTAKVTSIYKHAGTLFVSTYGNGVFAVDKNLRHYTTEQGLSDDVVYKIEGDNKGIIWCATDAGITEITGLEATPRFNLISGNTGLPDNIVRDLKFEGDRLLVSMQDSGVCYYDLQKKKILRPTFFSNWSLGTVMNSYSAGPKKLVIGTEKNGIFIINNGTFSIYRYDDYQIPGVNQLFYDKASQLWVASKKGISQFIEKRSHFIDKSKGLPDDKIIALTADKERALWVGSTSGISKLMKDEQGQLVIESILEDKRYTIACAATHPAGTIWFGTYGHGIIVIDAATRKQQTFTAENSDLPNDNISNIFFHNDSTAYISTLGGGLARISVKTTPGSVSFQVKKIYTEEDGLGSNYVYATITDEAGVVYVATDGGGVQSIRKEKFVSLMKKGMFTSNAAFSLCRDQYNAIWTISNADGILRFAGDSVVKIGLEQGLRDEQPQQLTFTRGMIFAVHSKGVDKIDCRTMEISHFDVLDNDLEPNLNAICVSRDWFVSGTTRGILIFRISREKADSVKPGIFLRSLQLNYKPFPLDSTKTFNHNENNFSFEFSGIWLKNPEKLQYRYKLSGLENQWLFSSEGKTVNYNNLEPGKYTFIAQVKNEEEVWSTPVTYSFEIMTPIWKRWWFWLIVAAALALGIYLFISYRLRSLQRENLLLELRVKERTAQIEKQSKIINEKNIELEQLSLVASKTDNVVLILSPDGSLEYVNESFLRLHNITLEELKTKYGNSIYELSNNENIRQIIDEAVAGRRSVSYESLNKKSEVGRPLWESSTLTPIFDENDQLKKVIIIDTDVSERKRQEQIIVQKNKDITDSISYARKIQHAILPDIKVISEHLPQSFILYMTKDIVSGDFYWFTSFEDCCIIAAVDCTGHGVPGAFMSLIGYNLLNRIVNENRITDPRNILYELNIGVLQALHKSESETKDGMDIAICKINRKEGILEFAGAMRPLWIINNQTLTEIKADKIPIGTVQGERHQTIAYTTHRIETRPGDRYYIFTDGYADQFGGAKDKKYSTSRFKNLLVANSQLDFASQEKNIRDEHNSWKAQNEQVDDILVIGFSLD